MVDIGEMICCMGDQFNLAAGSIYGVMVIDDKHLAACSQYDGDGSLGKACHNYRLIITVQRIITGNKVCSSKFSQCIECN